MRMNTIRQYMNIITENQGFISADGDEIPAVLYHGTLLETWQQHISKTGLDPAKTDPRGEDDEDYDDIFYNKGFVFLSWNIESAEAFAPGGDYNSYPGPGAIIAVHLDQALAGKLITSLGEFIRCPVVIPPRYLKLVEVTNQ